MVHRAEGEGLAVSLVGWLGGNQNLSRWLVLRPNLDNWPCVTGTRFSRSLSNSGITPPKIESLRVQSRNLCLSIRISPGPPLAVVIIRGSVEALDG